MIVVKIPLKDAEKTKKFIISRSLHDKNYLLDKEDGHLFIVLKDGSDEKELKKKFSSVRFVKRKMCRREIERAKLKDALEKKLTTEEIAILKTSFDTVGDIAVLEIDKELRHREKVIAEALLSMNKNIKTVLRKAGSHFGTFRTQKMVVLAGEKRKDTIHKENGIKLKLDVEKVYFSTRLGTERKRIVELVKAGEDVLVMFSGCGPYPCVISKNTEVRSVFGVEINPDGHRYAMENTKLNRLHNVVLINCDAKKAVPNIFHHIVGLKSSDNNNQLATRLKHHPHIMELHLNSEDLFEGKEKLEKTIQKLQKVGIMVVLHMPFSRDGKNYSLAQKEVTRELKMLNLLGKLCRQYHIRAVVHPILQINIAEDESVLIENIKRLERYYDYFYFENSSYGIFAKTGDVVRIGKKAGIKNVCIDTCHLFITYQDNDKIENHIKKVRKHFNTYFHLNDHDYKTHSCEIGKGFIDFSRILPYVNLGVTEVTDKDEYHPKEMVRSFKKVKGTHIKFDRILMPLPKSAEDFLDTALFAAKKGTIIHFYDFLNDKEFHLAHDKISIACKKNKRKFKILRTVKCGQHAPHVYRICVDFKMLD